MEIKFFSKNTKALFEYEIIQKLEAGIVLEDWEPAAIRKGLFNINDVFCRVIKGEIFLLGANIGMNINPNAKGFLAKKAITYQKRDKKLLLHKKEIEKIAKMVEKDGYTIIPLSVYANSKNKIKVEIAIAKGKKSFDKRADLKEKDIERYERQNTKGY